VAVAAHDTAAFPCTADRRVSVALESVVR
jgi:hypothetical protein